MLKAKDIGAENERIYNRRRIFVPRSHVYGTVTYSKTKTPQATEEVFN